MEKDKLLISSKDNIIQHYYYNKYSTCNLLPYPDNDGSPIWAVTTNYRVMVENNTLDDLHRICEPTEFHEKRKTFRLTCARVQADSFVRHRVFSFLMESTRYSNYSNGKFDGKIQVVVPTGWEDFSAVQQNLFFGVWNYAEDNYMTLIKTGVKPEDARDVLPLQLKTELIMTGTESQWEQFFKLRISDHAHPDAKYIAERIKEQL